MGTTKSTYGSNSTGKLATQASRKTFTDLTTPSSAELPDNEQEWKGPLVAYTTSAAQVSAFCRSVIGNLVPHEFWGTGDTGSHNRSVLTHAIDRFTKLRRFESLTLHDICHGMKVSLFVMLGTTRAPRTPHILTIKDQGHSLAYRSQ
jgi:hypothetical protein